jgi:putative redox protein
MEARALPPLELDLVWEGEMRFRGACGEVALGIDAAARTGPTPIQAFAFSLAGCMGIDVANILNRGRQPLQGLHARLVGERVATSPKRFTVFRLHFTVEGTIAPDRVERALKLSRDTYCSVWHSMRQDIEFTTSFEIIPAREPPLPAEP